MGMTDNTQGITFIYDARGSVAGIKWLSECVGKITELEKTDIGNWYHFGAHKNLCKGLAYGLTFARLPQPGNHQSPNYPNILMPNAL